MERPRGTVLAVFDGTIDARLVQAALPPGAAFRVAPLDAGADEVAAALRDSSPDLVLIGFGDHPDGAIEVIARARTEHPDGAVVVLQTGTMNGFMERVFDVGADDLVTLPQPAEALSFVFQKALARRRSAPSVGLGSMICIIGPKGGTGKTLTSCNLAVSLAQAGKSAVIVDLDLQFGDVGISLGLSPDRTIYHLATSGGSHDPEKLEQFIVRHRSGVGVLIAPTRPDQASAIQPSLLREIYSGLRATYDFVIVDTPPAFSPEVIASIDTASDLCVVGMLDVLSLKDTKIGLETLALMGHESADLKLVLNRADSDVGISRDDVIKILGRRPDVFIPSDRAIPLAITNGEPIVLAQPGSPAAAAFRDLANLFLGDDALHEAEAETAAAPTSPPLRRLFRKGA